MLMTIAEINTNLYRTCVTHPKNNAGTLVLTLDCVVPIWCQIPNPMKSDRIIVDNTLIIMMSFRRRYCWKFLLHRMVYCENQLLDRLTSNAPLLNPRLRSTGTTRFAFSSTLAPTIIRVSIGKFLKKVSNFNRQHSCRDKIFVHLTLFG